jgi:fatty-acyl-CoA synthase
LLAEADVPVLPLDGLALPADAPPEVAPLEVDQVMACIVVRGGASLTPAELGAFLAAQGDLGGKQHPRFVRVASRMPRTATFKVLTRLLAADRWNTGDPVWWRPDGRAPVYVPLGPEQATALDAGILGVR